MQRFSRQGVSVVMTFEIPDLFGAHRLSDSAIPPLSDNVVMLSYLRQHNTMKRTITVIKTRASSHDPAVRQFVTGPRGIVLDEAALPREKPDQDEGDLAGATLPLRQRIQR